MYPPSATPLLCAFGHFNSFDAAVNPHFYFIIVKKQKRVRRPCKKKSAEEKTADFFELNSLEPEARECEVEGKYHDEHPNSGNFGAS